MTNWITAAEDHARDCYPRESCGVLVVSGGVQTYRPCRNRARGEDHFVLHPADYAAAEADGEIIAIIHSHPNAAAHPSDADRVACEASGLPWHILSWPSGVWAKCEPKGYQAPLVGRPFYHGVLDCWALIRDGFRELRGVDLPDFERADDWWHHGGNLYLDNYERAGFRAVDDGPKPFDVILMQIASSVVNHAALYLGDDVILHHLQRRLSCRDVYGGYWRRVTRLIVRHESCAT